MLGIIPCCGYGTRMGMASHEAKEMLPDPQVPDKKIIHYALEVCTATNVKPLVVVRENKHTLVQYLKEHAVDFVCYDPTGEWAQTVYDSYKYWEEDNVLILPDTRFHPYNKIREMQRDLELGAQFSVALHKVYDPHNWGIVHNYIIYEKPHWIKEPAWAWGLIAFKKEVGKVLFSSLAKTDMRSARLKDASLHYLNSFVDLTR